MDTGRGGVRTSVEHALRGLLWDKVPRNHRQDPRPFLVRRVVTGVFVVIGAVVLGWSLQIDAGDSTFYVATLVLAAIWTIGAFASGPLYLGRIAHAGAARRPAQARRRRDSARAGAGRHLRGRGAGGAGDPAGRPADLQRAEPRERRRHAPAGAHHGGERDRGGAVLPRRALRRRTRHPVAVSTVAYVVATLATGNFMLAFAAILLGVVTGLERRASGGVLAPVLTHVTWSTVMLFALPLLF